MLADEILREGKPREALVKLQDQVRNNPSNGQYRTFLFQLLALLGEWDRAMTQLSVAGELDDGNLAMVQTYREALRCEVLRGEIFSGKRSPLLFGQPEEWVALMIEALDLTAKGEYAKSQAVRNKAFEQAPATSGTLDGKPFQWIADADPRCGPILEAIVNGHYYWIPIHLIRSVHIEEPQDLRDLVWMPAFFTWSNGGETVGLIPTRYPDTHTSQDDQLLMSRKTEWTDKGSELYLGLGQKILATDEGDFPLMDIREIQLNTASEESPAGADESIAED